MLNLDRRWVKIIHDLWIYKSRTFTVIMAIAIGVTGVGMVSTTQIILLENYMAQYRASNPADATIGTSSFGESYLRNVRNLPEVAAADARHTIGARIEMPSGAERPIALQAIPDFNAINVDRIVAMPGAIVPPPTQGVLLERSVLVNDNLHSGDSISVRMPDGKYHSLTIAGFVLDSLVTPTSITAQVYGFITFDTASWLENDEKLSHVSQADLYYDKLLVIANVGSNDQTEIESAMTRLQRDMARIDPKVTIGSVSIPQAGKPTLQDNLNAIWIVLQVAGAASLILSGFLVTNIMTALISQQIRQIGIMKAIGARTRQIIVIYLVMSMILGGIALIIAIPLGSAAGYGVTTFIAKILNADINTFYLPGPVLALQAGSALLVPAVATILPALTGTRMSAREAMSSSVNAASSSRLISRVLGPLGTFSMPVAFSVRNVFRQQLRLILTLTALGIGGTTFMAVIGTRGALNQGFDDLLTENNFNVTVTYRLDSATVVNNVEDSVKAIPGVLAVETWKTAAMHRVYADGSQSGSMSVLAVPPATQMLRLTPSQGHWLTADDQNQMYINRDALELLGPDTMTNPIKMDLNGGKTLWHVVGLGGRSLSPQGYITLDDYDRYFKNMPPVRLLVVQTTQTDIPYIQQVELQIMALFKAKKWTVISASIVDTGAARTQVNNVIYVLVGTALLIAAVGGLGLANTLELNIMERTREIGILRSLGAKSYVIRLMIVSESFTICVISTVIAALLSNPFGALLTELLGQSLLARHLPFQFSTTGLALWIAIITVLGLFASLSPTQRAINLTVRDTLAYE